MRSYTEKETKQNFLATLSSVFLLTIILYLVYNFKTDLKNQDSFFHLVNLKSYAEENFLKIPTEPFLYLVILFFKKVFFMSIDASYLFVSALSLSLFLHQILFLFNRSIWQTNHYIGVYLVSSLPFVSNLPTSYLQELVCLNFILQLTIQTNLETMRNLLLVFVLSVISFFASIPMFMFGYTLYIMLVSLYFMGKQKAKTTVFYKRKNKALVFMLVYLGLFLLVIILMSYFQFFGQSSFGFILSKFWKYTYRFISPIILLLVINYLLGNEKELHFRVTTILLVLFTVLGFYFSYKTKSDFSEQIDKLHKPITELYSSGKLLKGQYIFADIDLADYSYYFYNQKLFLTEFSKLKKDDYILVKNLQNEKALVDKSFKSKISPYIKLNQTENYLISREYLEKILLESKDSNLKNLLFSTVETKQMYTPYMKTNHYLGKLFGI
jgi:hypothetical protein